MSAPRPHGQALVETALGILLFVTLLMVGLYFGDIGFKALKVQDAANFALWDATGRQMHQTAGPARFDVYRTDAVSEAQANGTSYANAAVSSDVFVRSTPTVVAATVDPPIPKVNCLLPPNGAVVPCLAPLPEVAPAYLVGQSVGTSPAGNSGMTVSAQATVSAVAIPKSFLDRSFFGGRLNFANPSITLCSAGRARQGKCPAIPMLLDDFGMAGTSEGMPCPLQVNSGGTACPQNPGYFQEVQRVYDGFAGVGEPAAAGDALAQLFGGTPIIAPKFFMSYVGMEGLGGNYAWPFTDDLTVSHGGGVGPQYWGTTPWSAPGMGSSSYEVVADGKKHNATSHDLALGASL
jgi:hypothetical protein